MIALLSFCAILIVLSFPFIQDLFLYNQWKKEIEEPILLEYFKELNVEKVHEISGYSLIKDWEKEWDNGWEEQNNYIEEKNKIWIGETTTDSLVWN